MSVRTELLGQIRQKPVAILGYGTSGQGAHALARRMNIDCTCFDEREIDGTRQDFTRGDAYQHSAVVVSPGFKIDHPWLKIAREAGLPVLGELDFGGLFLRNGVYAVTGTNGKTTTTEFIAATLEMVGKPAVALGNNGRSLCAYLADHVEDNFATQIVLEISSYQAQTLWALPIVGLVWTNFSENHLDGHEDMQAYFAAKFRLVGLLNEPLFVCTPSVREAAKTYGQKLPDFTRVVDPTQDKNIHLPEGTPFGESPFAEDFRLCVAFGERIGVPEVLWHESARRNSPPPYRMQKINIPAAREFYNDSKSTTPASTLAGLARFKSPVIWIGGGKSKGGNLANFAKALAGKISSAHLIGETAELFSVLLRREGIPAAVYPNLESAVRSANRQAPVTAPILFSPGFSSLDQFKNFAERGLSFEKCVFSLQEQTLAPTKR
jgi:UDP-N-acetylmuramoylalanine--D-glutamate ligase